TSISAREPSPNALQKNRKIPEYENAIKRHSADFEQLATAIIKSQDTSIPELDRKVYEGYIAELTEAFEAAHGHIISSFYSYGNDAAVVLTDRQELELIDPVITEGIAPIAELLFECDRLNREADRVLARMPRRAEDLRNIKKLIYWRKASLTPRRPET